MLKNAYFFREQKNFLEKIKAKHSKDIFFQSKKPYFKHNLSKYFPSYSQKCSRYILNLEITLSIETLLSSRPVSNPELVV